MKGFVKHLDRFQSVPLSPNDYPTLLHDIQSNYTLHKLGPITTSLWQPAPTPICPIKLPKILDVRIDSLKDLIRLIDENPYESQYEYNIDLEVLHRIRGELVSIDQMIGLQTFKQSLLDQLLYFLQDLHKGGEGDFKHTVLMGPPGTGKTEVAKHLGNMYAKMGTLSNHNFKKVTRSDFIAGYLGQTAMKTQKLVESSLGGVLFFDEAYSISDPGQSDMFSKEAMDTLCECLSDHKDNLMVIIAGYEDALKQSFFSMNPGLESRFLWRFTMEAYSPKEMRDIFLKKVQQNGWKFENPPTISWFETKKETFLNYGRDMEGLFTYVKIAHGRRIYGGPTHDRKSLTLADLDKGYESFAKRKENKKSILYDMYL